MLMLKTVNTLMPINWANELFKTKKQAKTFIDDLATKNGWKK
jgi:hypothetical protein